jgi:putative membrane protein insertion efficiency factor
MMASVKERKAAGVGPGARVGLFALRFYKAYLSILFAGNCRFTPTCSQYSYEALERFGLARGSWLTLKRLLRCHPFSGKFGFDPVPECWHEHEAAPGNELSPSLEAPGPDFCTSAAGRHEVHI